jgi:hypothetical protein
MASAFSGVYSQGRANYDPDASMGTVDVKRTLTAGGFQSKRTGVLDTSTTMRLRRS